MLLLGQESGNYVCQSLQNIEIAERHVPSLFPLRSRKIDTTTQTMMFFTGTRLTLPTSLIDFPADWYTGIRISDQNIKTEFISCMHVQGMIAEFRKEEDSKTSRVVKCTLTACAAVMLVAVFLLLNL